MGESTVHKTVKMQLPANLAPELNSAHSWCGRLMASQFRMKRIFQFLSILPIWESYSLVYLCVFSFVPLWSWKHLYHLSKWWSESRNESSKFSLDSIGNIILAHATNLVAWPFSFQKMNFWLFYSAFSFSIASAVIIGKDLIFSIASAKEMAGFVRFWDLVHRSL